jgi:CheY-like chemotaxis protein
MAPHRIFVVEDEEMIRDSIVEFLAEQGYDVVGAADGRDALDKLDDSDPPPCLILLDLMMPVMDGRSFRARQLQIPELAQIPIVVFSAYQDVAKTAGELNAAGHLAKPLKLPDLLSTVRRHCANGLTSPP